MKHHLVITICFCATLLTACGKPIQVPEPNDEPITTSSPSDSLRLDSLFRLADSLHQEALHYQDMDSTVASCKVDYMALDILENHFSIYHLPEAEQLIKPERQMINLLSVIYRGMGSLYSVSNLSDPTSYFYQQDLAIKKKYSKSPQSFGSTLFLMGYAFDVSDHFDSACYYYDSAIICLDHDTSDFIFRQAVSRHSLVDYKLHHDATTAIHSLKALLPHCDFDNHDIEMTIGYIYKEERQYDSALVYLNRTFEAVEQSGTSNTAARSVTLSYLYEIYESLGETEKMNECAHLLAQYPHTQEHYAPTTSVLTELFNNYIQKKQIANAMQEQQQMRQEARRRNLWIGGGVTLLAIVGLAVAIVTRRSHRKRLAAQEAEAQRRLDEASKRLNEALQRHDETERELQTRVEQAAQHTKEVLQQWAMALYHSKEKDKLQRILAEFDGAYPKTREQMMATYPDLSLQEYELCVLGYFDFRAKEIAQLMDLQEGTVYRYRSTIRKKTGADDLEALVSRFLD